MKSIFEKSNHWLIFLGLGLVCAATYANSLSNGFMMDDLSIFLNDPKAHSLKNFGQYFVVNQESLHNGLHQSYYRPLAHVVPVLCYQMFQQNPFGYHLVNLVLFWLAAWFFYFFVVTQWQTRAVALLASLFFVVHPLNGYLVNYITASVFSVLLIFMFAGLLFFGKVLEGERGLAFFLSFCCFAITLLCHEVAVLFPAYALLLMIKNQQFSRRYWCQWAILMGLALAFLWFRSTIPTLKHEVSANWPGSQLSWLAYFASFWDIWLWHSRQLLIFDQVVFIWLTDPSTKAHWLKLFVLALKDGLVLFWCWQKGRRQPWGFFAVAYMLGWMPVAYACRLSPPQGLMLEPHWLVFTSLGFFVVLAHLLWEVWRRYVPSAGLVITGLLLVFFMASSWQYNRLWRDQLTYARYWVSQVPKLKTAHFHLASAYAQNGENLLAQEHFRNALSGNSSDHEIYVNLGLIDFNANMLGEARENFFQALNLYPRSAVAYGNLGNVEFREGHMASAIAAYQRALAEDPYLLEPRLNLAEIYLAQGDEIEGLRWLDSAKAIDTRDLRVVYRLATLAWSKDDKSEAKVLTQQILERSTEPRFLTTLASQAVNAQFSNLAMALLNKALNLDENFAEAYLESGKILGNQGQLNRAIGFWQEGWKRNPQDGRFAPLIEEAVRLLSQRKAPSN